MSKVKIKTKKAIRKRLILTGSGLFKMKPSSIRHRLTSKPTKKNRNNYGFHIVNSSDVKRISKYLHYFVK